MTDGTPLVAVVDVRKAFEAVEVLKGVGLRLDKGETLVVMGGSGSGKTVLLRLIDGLLHPDGGSIRLFGTAIERLSEDELLPLRRRLPFPTRRKSRLPSTTRRYPGTSPSR